MRQCSKCGLTKSVTEFYKAKNSRGNVYLRGDCKTCFHAAGRTRLPRYKDTGRKRHLRTTFGISVEQYETLLLAQNYVCAICYRKCSSGRNLAVDHCHESGRIRGLLCGHCNRGLGFFSDSPSRLTAAINYLK